MEIPGFEILEKLGQGAMGVVCKARQTSLNRTVAVKILKPEFSRSPAEVEAFLREARTAASLKHSNIIQVYDVGQVEDCPYIVMELVNGPSVGQLIESEVLSQKQALEITLAVASALQYAWKHAQLIHRDIKPHNIMIDADGTIKLSDLGTARRLTASAAEDDHETDILGTPNYMSPEQAAGDPMDLRSDMYSLGATLYHLLTGRIPFEGRPPEEIARCQIDDQLTNPRDVNASITIGATQLVTKLMMKHPDKRFSSWGDVCHMTKKVIAGRISLKGSKDADQSTIARQVKKGAGAAEGQPAGVKALRSISRRPKQAPMPFKIAATVVLLLLWSALAFFRLRLPPSIPLPKPQRESVPKPALRRPAPDKTRAKPASRPGRSRPQAVTQTSGPEPVPTTPAKAPDPEQVEKQMNAVLRDTLRALSVENFDKAKVALNGPGATGLPASEQARLEQIDLLVDQMRAIPAEMEESFRKKLGSSVSIQLDGTQCQIHITSLAAGKVYGTMRDATGAEVPVSFSIDRLSSAERCRWIPETDDPAHHAMKCVLLIKNGRAVEAKAHAPKCGPLAEPLTRLLAGRNGG